MSNLQLLLFACAITCYQEIHAETTTPEALPDQEQAASFAIDMPKLIQRALQKILQAHGDIQVEHLLLEQKATYFRCSPIARWRYIDTRSLDVPNQSGPASACEARITFVLKDTVKYEDNPEASPPRILL